MAKQTNLQIQILHQVATERGAAGFLDVQKYHDIMRVHVELKVVFLDVFVAEAGVQRHLLQRFAEIALERVRVAQIGGGGGHCFPLGQRAHLA